MQTTTTDALHVRCGQQIVVADRTYSVMGVRLSRNSNGTGVVLVELTIEVDDDHIARRLFRRDEEVEVVAD